MMKGEVPYVRVAHVYSGGDGSSLKVSNSKTPSTPKFLSPRSSLRFLV